MASIVMAILKATVGKLLNKGRRMVADRLKEGDVTDERFRILVVNEIDEIKSKLDGIARAPLLASISFFKEGILYLYSVLDLKDRDKNANETTYEAERTDKENRKVNLGPSAARVEHVSLSKELKSLQLTNYNDPATRALSDAKSRFKDARRKATEAFSNEALSTSDRLLSMQFRVMSTLLEKIDVPEDAILACRLCLEELHAIPAIQESFKVQLKKSFKSRFNKSERKEIITSVCRLNRAIFDVAQIVREDTNLFLWPCIDTGEGKVDLLLDYRVVEEHCQLDIEPFCVKPLALSHDAEEELHKRKSSWIMTTNTRGEIFILDRAVDEVMSRIQVFSSNGELQRSSPLPIPFSTFEFMEIAMATDEEDKIYVLGNYTFPGEMFNTKFVFVFDKNITLHHGYELSDMQSCYPRRFLVSDNNKLFLSAKNSDIRVFNTNGYLERRFGAGFLESPTDIAYTNTGKLLVLDSNHVHIFSEEGVHQVQFKLAVSLPFKPEFLVFHHLNNQVLVFCRNMGYCGRLRSTPEYTEILLSLYTISGVFVRDIHLRIKGEFLFTAAKTVTKKGRVIVCVNDSFGRPSVLVL